MSALVSSTSQAEGSYDGLLPSPPASAQAQPPSPSLPSFPSPPNIDSDPVASSSTIPDELELNAQLLVVTPTSLEAEQTARVKGKGREARGKAAEDEGSSGSALPTSGRWSETEEDALARFLSSIDDYSAVDEDGRDAFDGFATTNHTRRTARACRMHHRSSKPTFDVLIERIHAGLPMRESPEREDVVEEKPVDKKGKGREVEIVRHVEEDLMEDVGLESMDDAEPVDYELGTRPNSYNAVEEADFRRCLRESDTVVEASKKFNLLHPDRSYESIRRRHNRLSANYEGILTRKLDGPTFVRGGAPYWSEEEQEELAQLLAGSSDDVIAIHRVFQESHPRRTTAGIRGQYDRHRKKYDQRIQAIKDGDSSKPSPFIRETAKPKSRLSASPSPPAPSFVPTPQFQPRRPSPTNRPASPPPSLSFASLLSIPRLQASAASKRPSLQVASSSSRKRTRV